MPDIQKSGRTILLMTLFESELSFLITAIGLWAMLHFLPVLPAFASLKFYLPAVLLLGSLASPTDPSATLAVKTEFKAKGEVMSTIMGIAAFDDILGIINYSLATGIALALVKNEPMALSTVVEPVGSIAASIGIGIAFGFLLNVISHWLKKEEDSIILVLLSGILLLTFGVTSLLNIDSLLATMTVGVVVVNFNKQQEVIFNVLERYTDEIIFTLFFTISGLMLNFQSLTSGYLLIVGFIIFRFAGKALGVYAGGTIAGSPAKVRNYVTGGLLPQGSIVVGLALLMKQNPAFSSFSDVILNVVLGATVIHELLGPVAARFSLKKAGEI